MTVASSPCYLFCRRRTPLSPEREADKHLATIRVDVAFVSFEMKQVGAVAHALLKTSVQVVVADVPVVIRPFVSLPTSDGEVPQAMRVGLATMGDVVATVWPEMRRSPVCGDTWKKAAEVAFRTSKALFVPRELM